MQNKDVSSKVYYTSMVLAESVGLPVHDLVRWEAENVASLALSQGRESLIAFPQIFEIACKYRGFG